MQPRTYGMLLVGIATIMWSTAGLFVRALDLDIWTVLGWRSLFGGLALTVIIFAKKRISAEPGKVPFYFYPLFGLMAATSMYGYVSALKLTTVANVLAIYATVPFVAAGIAYVWLKETISRRVLIASLIAFVGVLIVAGFGARPQDIAGNALAFLMTVTFSILLVAAKTLPSAAAGAGQCARIRLLRAALPALDVSCDAEPAGNPCACRFRVDDIGDRLSALHDRRPLYSIQRGRVDRAVGRRARPALGLARLLRDA